MGAFKAYDIRGIYNKDFNAETAYKIGFFIPKLLNASYVVVGHDTRLSSEEIFNALANGITDSGADVWDIGLSTTPLVYFSTVFYKANASVQITASHNPGQYNGMKISRTGAIPVGGESGLKDLEKLVETQPVVPVCSCKKGEVIKKDIYPAYIEFMKKFMPDLTGLNLSIDCSNGMSSLFVHKLFGENAHYINDYLDGNFPAHEPNPLEEKNCKQIEEAVVANKSDCGIIYDGDADRVLFIDEKGRFIQPDFTTSVIGRYFAKKEKGTAYVDVRTSRSTTEYLSAMGIEPIVYKVGHAFAKNLIRENGCIFGGELAGHYYFRDFFCCDSGILASLLVLQTVAELKKEGKTLSSLLEKIIRYANSGEQNFKLDRKDEAMEAIKEKYMAQNPDKIYDIDGYRIEFPTWWFSVRKSNTEPFLRLVVEAKTEEELKEHLTDLSEVIKRFC